MTQPLSSSLQHTALPPLPEELEWTLCTRLPSTPDNYWTHAAYLDPNEGPVTPIAPLLEQMTPGWIVSAGTVRSLFDLILAPQQCAGVIVRDLNPLVKDYIEYLVILLKTCDHAEFVSYAAPLEDPRFCQARRVDQLKERVQKHATLHPHFKEHYIQRLDACYSAYYQALHTWTIPGRLHSAPIARCLQDVNFHLQPELFNKLKAYACAGRIIATTGNINDLIELGRHGIAISVIDFSNITGYTHDYTHRKLSVYGSPLFIDTTGNILDGIATTYRASHLPSH